ARSTSDVYSLDVQTGKVDRWTYSETGGLNTANFSEPQLIHWKSWDGREISGFLYRPPAKFTGKRPVIVNIHGGPEGQFRPGFLALAVAMNYTVLISCSVDVVGPSNLVTFLEHTSGYRQDLRRVEYGDERDPKMHDFLERIAPFNKTKNITKPLFVIAGKNDP